MARPVLQSAIGEAAGGSADVQHCPALKADLKLAERLLQLEAAAADIRMHSTLHF
ncbi:hypothetical protein D3C73_791030 [compost metagenome]